MWIWWVGAALAAPSVLRFESGLRVVVERAEGTGWVATSATFDEAGEAFVPEGQEHLAHLVEHLWYRAEDPTNHARLFALGCDTQAITWPFSMEFLETCPADVIDPLLELHAARLDDALRTLDAADVEIERDVVELEVGAYRETSRTAVSRAVAARIHPDSAWAQRMRREGISNGLDLTTSRDWAREHLRADRAVIAIVSPFPVDELRPRLERHFGRVVSTATVGPLTKPLRQPRRTLRVDVRPVEANVEEPVVVASWELPMDAVAVSTPLAWFLEFTLHLTFVRDARYEGVACFDQLIGQVPVVTCAVEVADGVDPARFAERVRAASDVREGLELGLVRKFLRQLVEKRDSEPVLGTLLPIPFNRPSVLAHRMVTFNRTFDDDAPRVASKREAKRLQAAAVEALDPQRALLLAVTPDGIKRAFPAARPPSPDSRALATAPAPAARPARLVRYQGVLGISRPDLDTSWVLSFDGREPTDAEPIPDATEWSPGPGAQRVVIGPLVTESAASSGDVARVPYGRPDPVAAGVRFEGPDGPLAEVRWECRVAASHGAALLVWQQVVAWRAWHALRAETAWSYTPTVDAMADGLVLTADVRPDATKRAIAAMQTELTEIADGSVSPAELGAAVRRASVVASPGLALLPHWPSLLLGPTQLRSAEELDALPGAVARVDLAAVRSVAGTCAPADGWTVRSPALTTPGEEAP